MSNQFRLRRAEESDYQAIKDLIFNSTNDWYQKNFKKNHEVGIYMPYGKEWLSYTVRRLKEFKNIKFVAENLIKEK